MEGSDLRVERAAPEDAAHILGLQRLAYQSEARLYDDWNLPPLVQTLESLQAEFSNSVILKALDRGQLAGSVRAREAHGTCHIGRLVVSPPAQGRGIGTRLMQEIEASFPLVRRFELFTGSRSEGNLRLYRRLGYLPCREQSTPNGVTLVFLEKSR